MLNRHRHWLALIAGFGFVLATLSSARGQSDPASLAPYEITLNPDMPAPADFIGHGIGDDAVRYDAMVRYLRALDEASDFVTMSTYGTTHEGRDLFLLFITSEANHARLDEIRDDNAKLADPRRLTNRREGDRIISDLPAIAWLAYAIHGDELSPCDSAVAIAYMLAAGTDDTTRRLRDELVIIIDPLQNPDGRERYLAQLQSLRGTVPNTDFQSMSHAGLWSAGRGNHYLFDLNRDWLMQSQPETRARTKVFKAWNPHLVVDAHEMGGLDTYLFDPPREPLNIHVADALMQWRRQMSQDQAAAFNAFGWSYYTQEWYDEWYPGYTNAWASLNGAIGLLYEQAGVNGTALKQAAGNVLTYHEAVHHNIVSSFANLETLRANREDILRDAFADRQAAVASGGPFDEHFLFPPDPDRARRARLLSLLDVQGLEYDIADEPVIARDTTDIEGATRDRVELPAGTIVVRSNQPRRRMLHALFGFDPRMSDTFLKTERTELERGRSTLMYDISAWNIPMAYGIDAYTSRDVGRFRTTDATGAAVRDRDTVGESAFGYIIPFDQSDVYVALSRMFEAGVTIRSARKPFSLDGRSFSPGALLIRNNENDDSVMTTVRDACAGLHVEVLPIDTALADSGPDLGGQEFTLLHPPRVAIASQWPISTTSFGSTWFLFDHRAQLRVSPVNVQYLSSMDLRRYNVLIIPSGGGLGAVLSEGAMDNLRTWVEAGGTLIAMGGSTALLASEESLLSQVRRRRAVLDDLEVYDEAVQREIAARNVAVDADQIWNPSAAASTSSPDDDEASDDDHDDDDRDESGLSADSDQRARDDAWARRFSPSGMIATAHLDREHWLCFGLNRDRLPVPVAGSSVYVSRPPVSTPVRMSDEATVRMSGLLWPEFRPRLAHSAFATVERVGRGQVILFAHDPFFRGYWESTGRLLQNAAMLGPGMGTSQPIPW